MGAQDKPSPLCEYCSMRSSSSPGSELTIKASLSGGGCRGSRSVVASHEEQTYLWLTNDGDVMVPSAGA